MSRGKLEGSHGSHRAAPEPMCLPIMTQAGHEHATQCISLVHTDVLRFGPQIAVNFSYNSIEQKLPEANHRARRSAQGKT